MRITETAQFKNFKHELDKIAKSEPVAHLKDDLAHTIVRFAQTVPKSYSKNVAQEKAKSEAPKGALTVFVSAVAYSVVKPILAPVIEFEPEVEKAIFVLISAGVAAAFHGLQSYFWNWRKHKDYI